MKNKLLIILFLFITSIIYSQAIVKGTGIIYTNGVPTHIPRTSSESEYAIDVSSNKGDLYLWNRASNTWLLIGEGVDVANNSSVPVSAPGYGQSRFRINNVPTLYFWTGVLWVSIGGGSSYTAGTGIDITGLTISNTGDLSTTNELQQVDTFEYNSGSRELRLSLSSDGVPYKIADLSALFDTTIATNIYTSNGTVTGDLRVVQYPRSLWFRQIGSDTIGFFRAQYGTTDGSRLNLNKDSISAYFVGGDNSLSYIAAKEDSTVFAFSPYNVDAGTNLWHGVVGDSLGLKLSTDNTHQPHSITLQSDTINWKSAYNTESHRHNFLTDTNYFFVDTFKTFLLGRFPRTDGLNFDGREKGFFYQPDGEGILLMNGNGTPNALSYVSLSQSNFYVSSSTTFGADDYVMEASFSPGTVGISGTYNTTGTYFSIDGQGSDENARLRNRVNDAGFGDTTSFVDIYQTKDGFPLRNSKYVAFGERRNSGGAAVGSVAYLGLDNGTGFSTASNIRSSKLGFGVQHVVPGSPTFFDYFRVDLEVFDTTRNNVSFYNRSYYWKNADPSPTVGDTSIHYWAGNGTGTVPGFMTIDDLVGGISQIVDTVFDYTDLRAYSKDSPLVFVKKNGIEGLFKRVTGSFADDGGITIVGTNKWKRVTEEPEIVNVKWFEAVGDSITDDNTAIQAALAVALSDSGSVLFFPTGKYRYTQTIAAYKPVNFSIRGAGMDNTFLFPENVTGIYIKTDSTAVVQVPTYGSKEGRDMMLGDFSIYRTGSNTYTTPIVGIYILGGFNKKIENVRIEEFFADGGTASGKNIGLKLDNPYSLIDAPSLADDRIQHNTLENVFIAQCDTGLVVRLHNTIQVSNVRVDSNKKVGARLSNGIHWRGGMVQGNFNCGVYIMNDATSIKLIEFSGVHFEGNANTVPKYGTIYKGNSTTLTNFGMTGCLISQDAGAKIFHLRRIQYADITNNYYAASTTDTLYFDECNSVYLGNDNYWEVALTTVNSTSLHFLSGDPNISIEALNGVTLQRTTAGPYALNVGGTTVVDDNLGVGEQTPDTKLHVTATTDELTALQKLENSTGDNKIFRTDTDPETVITGNPGDIAVGADGVGSIWVKRTGTGNTGWLDIGGGVLGFTNIGNSDLTTTDASRTLNILDDLNFLGDGVSPNFYGEFGSLSGSRFSFTDVLGSVFFTNVSGTNRFRADVNGLRLTTTNTASRSILFETDTIVFRPSFSGDIVQVYESEAYTFLDESYYIDASAMTTGEEYDILVGTNSGGKSNLNFNINGAALSATTTATGTSSVSLSTSSNPSVTILSTPAGSGFNAFVVDGNSVSIDTDEGDPFQVVAPTVYSVTVPASITVSVNDYSPTDLEEAYELELTPTAEFNITGLLAQQSGREVVISNASATYNINFISESGSSSAANRFTGGDVILTPGRSVRVRYVAGSLNRWRFTATSTSLAGGIVAGGANQIFGMNAAGTANEWKTFNGTTNQVTITDGVGTKTWSLPQDIHTAATPTFSDLTLTDDLFVTDDVTIGTSSINNLTVAGSALSALNLNNTGVATIGTTSGDLILNSGASGGFSQWTVNSNGEELNRTAGNTSGTTTTTDGVRTDYIMNDGSALDGGHFISVDRYQSRGVASTIRSGAQVVVKAPYTWTDASVPAQFLFSTTPVNSTTLVDRMLLNHSGEVQFLGSNGTRYYDTDNSNFVHIRAPQNDSLTTDYTLVLPRDNGGDGQTLKIRGDSLLYWGDDGGADGNGIYGDGTDNSGDDNLPTGGTQITQTAVGNTLRMVANTGNTTLREMMRLSTAEDAFTRFFVFTSPVDSARFFRATTGRQYTWQTYGGAAFRIASDSIISFLSDSLVFMEGIAESKTKVRFLLGTTPTNYLKRIDGGAAGAGEVLMSDGTDWVVTNPQAELRPAQLAATTNNWNPTGYSTFANQTIRFSGDNSFRTVTGLTAATRNRVTKTFYNDGTNCVVFAKQHTSSSAGNRFDVSQDVVFYPGVSATFAYDSVGADWELVSTNRSDVTYSQVIDYTQRDIGASSGDDWWVDFAAFGGTYNKTTASAAQNMRTNRLITGAVATSYPSLTSYTGQVYQIINKTYMRTYARVRFEDLSTALEDFDFRMGFGNGIDTLEGEGAQITYKREINSGGFHIRTHNGSTATETAAGSALAADTYYEIELIYYPYGEVTSFIDGVRYTTTSTLPDATIGLLVFQIDKDNGSTSREVLWTAMEAHWVYVSE